MYRAVVLAGMRCGYRAVPAELARLAETIDLQMAEDRILLDGEDVTDRVRSSDVTAVTRYAADNPQVRARLVELQRAWAGGRNVVTEGRDQGTVAFPQAQCKIFITASARSGPGDAGVTYNCRANRSRSSRSWPRSSAATARTPAGASPRWSPPPTLFRC